MHIIIDGYNLIGTLHKDMEKAREGLIDLLIDYIKIKNYDITVVFDAYKQGNSYEHSSYRGGIRIIYTRLGQTADDVIKRMISEVRREWIIITSDRDVINYTWSMNSIPISSDIFYEILQKNQRKKAIDVKYIEEFEQIGDDEDNIIKHQKGRSYTLSKKQKSIKRILNKL